MNGTNGADGEMRWKEPAEIYGEKATARVIDGRGDKYQEEGSVG